jgi:uncharacterized membrane protein
MSGAMSGFTTADYLALAWFAFAWAGYSVLMEFTALGHDGLNRRMDRFREAWMENMQTRELRIVDSQIMTSLQNGTAFFASTALIAIGGTLALLRSTEEVMAIFAALPFASRPTATVWEVKTLGLLVIFAYTFFKFAWSYRLFNYAAILLGATPEPGSANAKTAGAAAARVAAMTTLAGRHFNRGQRAFFLAIGYLGWFINAYALAFATAVVVLVLLNRQLGTAARQALPD